MSGTMDDEPFHRADRCIGAAPAAIYRAFLDPDDLVRWMPPEGAVGCVDVLEPWPGGRFHMALKFAKAAGKTSANTDRVIARFLSLVPNERIVLGVTFASARPEYAGTMTMTWSLTPDVAGTCVSIVAANVPSGISRADHETGMSSTLANLAAFVERAGPR